MSMLLRQYHEKPKPNAEPSPEKEPEQPKRKKFEK